MCVSPCVCVVLYWYVYHCQNILLGYNSSDTRLQSHSPPTLTTGNSWSFPPTSNFSLAEYYVNGIIPPVTFHNWLFTLSIMPLRSIHAVKCIQFITFYCYVMVHMYLSLLTIHLLQDILLDMCGLTSTLIPSWSEDILCMISIL